MNLSMTALLGVAIAGLYAAPRATAQSCDAMLIDLSNWSQTQPGGSIGFSMATNRADGLYVGYAAGNLFYHPQFTTGWVWFPARLQGETTEYFSDRQFFYPPGSLNSAPFDPTRTGQTGISITIPGVVPSSNVTITMPWGGSYSFAPSCQNGVMYGFSGVDDTIFSMSFKKVYPPR
jgi:hypothetical protein